MPATKYLEIVINNQSVDVGDIDSMGIKMNYLLEDPENFESKQASDALDISLPATKLNDQIFNTFHNPEVEDLTPGGVFRDIMSAAINVNGTIPIIRGVAQLTSATNTDMPEGYNVNIIGGNGDWITNMQNLTVWDCLSTTPHTFDVATVEASWTLFDSDEAHDYVYAPVRYRQPFTTVTSTPGFGQADMNLNIYSLRPSISIYWIIIRAFRQFGYTVKSDFLSDAAKFRRMVMPWTWGDFYDINSQITDGMTFKAAGVLTTTATPGTYTTGIYFTGTDPTHADWTSFETLLAVGSQYIKSQPDVGGGNSVFDMSNIQPPNGFDNFGLYSFDIATGKMSYAFNPPANLAPFIGSNVTLEFSLSLYVGVKSFAGSQCDIQIEVYNGITLLSSNSILPGVVVGAAEYPCSGIGAVFPFIKNAMTPTVYNFSVNGVNVGDTLHFRLKSVQSGGTACTVVCMNSGYLNANPTDLGTSPWQYDPTTQKWKNIHGNTSLAQWQPEYSTFAMTGLQIILGSDVHFQWYDAFRNYNFLDLLAGVVDMFDLEVQTDPINQTVTIEPTHSTVWNDGTAITGYFDTTRILDYTEKQDQEKARENQLFSNYERQVDFTMKQDGSDGGQNIYTARYKGLNTTKVIKNRINQAGRIDNGLIAAVPGASRYMFNNRFLQGNRQRQNRFFSPCMHYRHSPWQILSGVAPQLICIIPENISDSSASAVTQTFEPKIAFYKGYDPGLTWFNDYGGWIWVGDPASPNMSPIKSLPYMFAVNYGVAGHSDPVLTYCDQFINGSVIAGLMRTFFLKRLAIMRNGQLCTPYMRLNLNDICNFEHREPLKIGNSIYALIGIADYNPLTDESCKCTVWRMVNPQQIDVDNCYPSQTTVATTPTVLTNPYDLKYAPLLLFYTDIPQTL